jgi:hypothetical protein
VNAGLVRTLRRIARVYALALFFCALEVNAHRPYEREAGRIKRGDGVMVRAVKYYVDGILGEDPVSVQFRSTDGTLIAATGFTRDTVVVKNLNEGFEIFFFATDQVPVARKVERFDGFVLKDSTTVAKRATSPLLHTAMHWREYLFVLMSLALLLVARRLGHFFPKGGWRGTLGQIVHAVIQLVIGLVVLVFILIFPVSIFIVSACGVLLWKVCKLTDKHTGSRLVESQA